MLGRASVHLACVQGCMSAWPVLRPACTSAASVVGRLLPWAVGFLVHLRPSTLARLCPGRCTSPRGTDLRVWAVVGVCSGACRARESHPVDNKRQHSERVPLCLGVGQRHPVLVGAVQLLYLRLRVVCVGVGSSCVQVLRAEPASRLAACVRQRDGARDGRMLVHTGLLLVRLHLYRTRPTVPLVPRWRRSRVQGLGVYCTNSASP